MVYIIPQIALLYISQWGLLYNPQNLPQIDLCTGYKQDIHRLHYRYTQGDNMKRSRGEGSIYRDKRGRIIVAVSAGYDPATGKRKRIVRVARTMRDAIIVKKKLLEAPSGATQKNIMLGDWLLSYADTWIFPNVAYETKLKYKVTIKRLSAIAGARKLSALTRQDIKNIINDLKKKYAPSTAKVDAGFFLRSLVEGVEQGLLPPFGKIKINSLAKPRKIEMPTQHEWSALLTESKKIYNGMVYYLVLITALTGVRRGELCALTWDKIDLTKRLILIDTAIQGSHYNDMTAGDTKTHVSRIIPISDILYSVLTEWRKIERETLLLLGWTANYQNTVIYGYGGKPLSKSYCTTLYHKAAQAAGTSLRLHDLRHIYATQLISAGVSIKAAQAALGHASASTTLDIYAGLATDWQDEIKGVSPPMALLSAIRKNR